MLYCTVLFVSHSLLTYHSLPCHTATLSHCHTVTLSHCHTATLPPTHTHTHTHRFFEISSDQDDSGGAWFGGGADLTPYYLFDEDATAFHEHYKGVCESKGQRDVTFGKFKKW